jgi:hypothetical protein
MYRHPATLCDGGSTVQACEFFSSRISKCSFSLDLARDSQSLRNRLLRRVARLPGACRRKSGNDERQGAIWSGSYLDRF